MRIVEWFKKQLRRRNAVEDKLPQKEMSFSRKALKVGRPFVSKAYPNKFYKYDPELSECVAGYKEGTCNPYVEKLMGL